MWVLLPLFYLLQVLHQSNSQENICTTVNYMSLTTNMQNQLHCVLLERLIEQFQAEKDRREEMMNEIIKRIEAVNTKLNRYLKKSESTEGSEEKVRHAPSFSSVPSIRECNELNINGIHESGIYPIKLPLGKTINVWCDMGTDKGGWTVIQRRTDGSVDFNRTWNDYAFGFGNPNGEYWLGNEYIYQLTSYYDFTLRIDMTDWEGDSAYAEYEFFYLSNEQNGYRIQISSYTGTAGDSFQNYHNDMRFSTYDKDNDLWYASCAKKDGSGWWYRDCGFCTLNGMYVENGIINVSPDGLIKGIIWYHWKNRYTYSLKTVEMKIKPTVAIKVEREVLQDLIRTTAKPPRTTTEPPKTTIKPQHTTSKPQITTVKPQHTTARPQKTTRKPRRRNRKPKKTTRKPQKTTRKPRQQFTTIAQQTTERQTTIAPIGTTNGP